MANQVRSHWVTLGASDDTIDTIPHFGSLARPNPARICAVVSMEDSLVGGLKQGDFVA